MEQVNQSVVDSMMAIYRGPSSFVYLSCIVVRMTSSEQCCPLIGPDWPAQILVSSAGWPGLIRVRFMVH